MGSMETSCLSSCIWEGEDEVAVETSLVPAVGMGSPLMLIVPPDPSFIGGSK